MNALPEWSVSEQPQQFFFWLILVLITFAILIILFILISRARKSYLTKRDARLSKNFQDLVNALVFMDSVEEIKTSIEFLELRSSLSPSSAKQLLISYLQRLKKSLSGSSTNNLDLLFQELELHHYSLRKLTSAWDWKTRTEGIQELSIFNVKSSVPYITQYLNSKQETVREEAFIALILLDRQLSLTFLDLYTARISPWMRIRIHQYLTTLDARLLPQFSRWFHHPVIDVALFSMSMARQFRQLSAVPDFIQLMKGNERKKIGPAIKALGEMGAHEAIDDIIQLIDTYWNEKKTSIRIILCLGELAHHEKHHHAIARFLGHPFFDVTREAARVLQRLNPFVLEKYAVEQPQLMGIVRHVKEPLLQY